MRLWMILMFCTGLLLSGCAANNDDGDKTVMADISEMTDFDELWDYADPSGTRAKFEEMCPAAEAGEDKSYYLQLLTQVARTYGLETRFDSAHQILDNVEAALTDDLKLARVRYLLERGRAFRSGGEAVKSFPLFEEAMKLGQQIGADYFTIDAAHMLAIVAESREDRLKWSLAGLEIAEQSEHKRARHWLGSIYNNVGWDYHTAGEFDKALDMFEKALAAREEEGEETTIDIAKWCVARTYRSLERIDEALEIQVALYEKQQASGKSDGYTSEELGELYLIKGEKEKAREFFASAYKALSQDNWLIKNEAERINRIKKLAGLE